MALSLRTDVVCEASDALQQPCGQHHGRGDQEGSGASPADRRPGAGSDEAEAAPLGCGACGLDSLCWLNILRQLNSDLYVVTLRGVSTWMRALADAVLRDSFHERCAVREVLALPAAAPAYAAAQPAAFVLCHQLEGRESLAALAVRYGTDVLLLKRLNNLMSDHAMHSRSHMYVPLPSHEAPAGGLRVAFVHDERIKRKFVVVVPDGQELPAQLAGGAAAAAARQRGRNQEFVVARLAVALQRALRVDQATAAYYVTQAGCDVRQAIATFEEDKRWEQMMRHRGSRLFRG